MSRNQYTTRDMIDDRLDDIQGRTGDPMKVYPLLLLVEVLVAFTRVVADGVDVARSFRDPR